MIISFVILFIWVRIPSSHERRYSPNPYEVNNLPFYRNERSMDVTEEGNVVDNTVNQVQNILRATPGVPRLTKGEILDLLEQLAREDYRKMKINSSRNAKAVMVVMPYSPSRNTNVEELYTRKPVTKIIDSDDTTEVKLKRPLTRRRNKFRIPTTEESVTRSQSFVDLNPTPASSINQLPFFDIKAVPEWKPQRNTEVTTSTKPPTRRLIRRKQSQKPTTTKYLGNVNTIPESSMSGIHLMKSPVFNPIKNELILSTIKETKYTKDKESQALELDEAKKNIKFLESLLFKTETTESSPTVENPMNNLPADLLPLFTTTSRPLTDDLQIPDSLKELVKDLNLDTTVPKQSFYDKNKAKLKVTPLMLSTTTTKIDVDAEAVAENLDSSMKELLMSFGLLPNTEKVESREEPIFVPSKPEVDHDAFIGFKPLPEDGHANEEMEKLLASFGLGRSSRRGRNIKRIDKNLNFDMIPDSMAPILKDIGLINDLADKNEQTGDLENVLFLDNNNDIEKQDPVTEISVITHIEDHNTEPTKPIDKDELKDFLTEKTEINDSVADETDIVTEINVVFNGNETLPKHIFNPTEVKNIEKNKKLEKLMNVVKKHLNSNTTDQVDNVDIKDLKELTTTLNENHLKILNKYIENDNSTQINENTSIDSTTVNTVTDNVTIEDQKESDSNNLLVLNDDKHELNNFLDSTTINSLDSLADSFPQPDSVTSTPEEITKTNGFYYLIDWNTFLEVDDTKGKRVNLRFQPKVGNSKQFYSVSVP